ncbi:31 kDa ribonucleoprotein, chloroplastic [Phalaenopsis equestris]|uniref:31 kDa ribonucleoprotein, chloroplastic n=1 Tax=Phalaenopsis equestris TaxID=78828 RepID=UPI0009E3A59F|nr:31 kDa ribonucleoprotein, chloroplastic [Phalaenopsis equestris]XP_020589325.1 31 kDa ribonucleoprotein, chloroplastic [Phalaenopsis equestris]XP_020589326.1 31 kDa ribonucleoprotein, chloroplastic [Phalaenopsis equestris]
MALSLVRHLPLSAPTLLFLPSSKSYQLNPLFTSSSSSSSSSLLPFFHQRNKATLIQRQCTPLASSPVGSSAALVSEQEAEESEDRPAAPRRRLIAQNIPWTCTAEEIKSLFERHGTVVDVELSMYDNSRNRGLAFITMASEEEALLALNNLNSYDLNGRVIKVGSARSLKKNPGLETIAPTTFNVFVGNLAWRVRSRDLRELFGNVGKLVSAEVIFQSNPRRSAGYGFVSYATKEEAEAAIAAHNEKRLMGRKIRLVLGKPQAYKTEEQSSGDILSLLTSRESNPQGEIPFQTDDRLI